MQPRSFRRLRNLTWPNKLAYAERWGYHIEDATGDPVAAQFYREAAGAGAGLKGPAGGGGGGGTQLQPTHAAAADQGPLYYQLLNVKLKLFVRYIDLLRAGSGVARHRRAGGAATAAAAAAPRCDWLFWSDADSIFLNFTAPLHAFVAGLHPRYHVVIPAGPSKAAGGGTGRYAKVVNTGSFFIAASRRSRVLFSMALLHSLEPCDHDTPKFNGWLRLCKTHCCEWGDQGALMETLLVAPELEREVLYVGFRRFGSIFPHYGEGDLVVHLPGRTTGDRLKLLRLLLRHTDVRTGTMQRPLDPAIVPDVSDSNHRKGVDYTDLNSER